MANPTINQIEIGGVTYDIEAANGGLDSVTDLDVKLSSELKTYYSVGKVTASGTDPVVIGNKDDTLRTVFNNLFNMTAVKPTTSAPSLSLSLSNNSASIEYGATVTFKATITASPGRFNGDYYNTKPEEATATGITWGTLSLESTNSTFATISSGITSGTQFTVTPTTTCYAVASGGTVKGKATAPSGYSQGTPIVYAKNNLGEITDVYISGNTSKQSSIEQSTSVQAGYTPYAYVLAETLPAANTVLPSNRSKTGPSSIPVTGGTDATYLFIFVPTGKSLKTLAAGPLAVPFEEVTSSRSYIVNNSKATTFRVYKTKSTVKADTFTATYS